MKNNLGDLGQILNWKFRLKKLSFDDINKKVNMPNNYIFLFFLKLFYTEFATKKENVSIEEIIPDL